MCGDDDMYDVVLIDSPLGQFFQRTEKKDFDEFSMEYIRSLLCKNYYEGFYDFCRHQSLVFCWAPPSCFFFSFLNRIFGLAHPQAPRKGAWPGAGGHHVGGHVWAAGARRRPRNSPSTEMKFTSQKFPSTSSAHFPNFFPESNFAERIVFFTEGCKLDTKTAVGCYAHFDDRVFFER